MSFITDMERSYDGFIEAYRVTMFSDNSETHFSNEEQIVVPVCSCLCVRRNLAVLARNGLKMHLPDTPGVILEIPSQRVAILVSSVGGFHQSRVCLPSRQRCLGGGKTYFGISSGLHWTENRPECLAKAWSDTFAVRVHTYVTILVPISVAPVRWAV